MIIFSTVCGFIQPDLVYFAYYSVKVDWCIKGLARTSTTPTEKQETQKKQNQTQHDGIYQQPNNQTKKIDKTTKQPTHHQLPPSHQLGQWLHGGPPSRIRHSPQRPLLPGARRCFEKWMLNGFSSAFMFIFSWVLYGFYSIFRVCWWFSSLECFEMVFSCVFRALSFCLVAQSFCLIFLPQRSMICLFTTGYKRVLSGGSEYIETSSKPQNKQHLLLFATSGRCSQSILWDLSKTAKVLPHQPASESESPEGMEGMVFDEWREAFRMCTWANSDWITVFPMDF